MTSSSSKLKPLSPLGKRPTSPAIIAEKGPYGQRL